MLLDTSYKIGTPEGVELRLPVAGIASRSLAWLIDAFIKLLGLTVISLLFRLLGEMGNALMLLVMFAGMWLYNVLFEVLRNGATPGKSVLGLRVMNSNGTPVGWTGSILRNLIRFVDALPGCYAFGCVAVLVSRQFQRLGDMAAGTMVVYHSSQNVVATANKVEPLPITLPLRLDEQQAIVSYGERVRNLNPERAAELAAVLEPLLPSVNRDRLAGHASWLMRGQAGE